MRRINFHNLYDAVILIFTFIHRLFVHVSITSPV